jgi:hypothetical protein
MLNLVKASQISNHCQRNWDYNTPIPQDDIDKLTTVGTSMPTKQNLAYYKLIVSTNRDFNHYCFTKSIDIKNDDTFTRNTQVDAPLLFLWCYEPNAVLDNQNLFVPDKSININFDRSISISLGGISLAAAQLGYRTGFCQCVQIDEINKKLKSTFNKELNFSGVFLGVGKPHPKAEHWYQVLDDNGIETRIVYPEIKKEIEIINLS